MKSSINICLLTLAMAVGALLVQTSLWPPAPGTPSPVGVQLVLFAGLSVLSALTFGAGISFLVFGLPFVRRTAAVANVPAWPVYLAIGWSLVSWWPHNNMHLANGADLSGLLAIEYGFHVSLYVTAFIVAWFFLASLRTTSARQGAG